jgi:hypothetical protein
LKILFLADVFGVPGRRAVEEHLPRLREEYDADLAIVNGENAADGAGITAKLADKLLAAGADVVTLGNHTYRRGGIASYLATSERVIRPANSGTEAPGRGLTVAEARNGVSVAVINLLGQLFLPTPISPWRRRAQRRRWSSSTSTPKRRARRSPLRPGSTAGSPR